MRFRGAKVHVYSTNNDQFLLEDRINEKPDKINKVFGHTVTVKRMRLGNAGLIFLRLLCT